MLEIICAGSLAWSINVCQGKESLDLALIEVEISNVIKQDITWDREQLAKGKPYESDYRREADRDREQNEIQNDIRSRDRDRDRIHRDADYYRREGEYGEGDRDRIIEMPINIIDEKENILNLNHQEITDAIALESITEDQGMIDIKLEAQIR